MPDPALIWEAEAIRRSTSRTPSQPVPNQGASPAGRSGGPPRPLDPARWVTLREAHDATGVAVSTLRTWARAGKVSGQLTEGRWWVSLADVGRRAERRRSADTGQVIAPPAAPYGTPEGWPPQPSPAATDGSTMLVPIDAWERVLAQLGNLHEAGQQLADARERAAKAETEAKFLREQLAELRQVDRARADEISVDPPQPLSDQAPHSPSDDSPAPTATRRGRFRRWFRDRR